METLKFFFAIFILLLLSGCDKEISRSLLEPAPLEGVIAVSSTPPGSTIFINGRNTGRVTPDSITFLDPADYYITLKKKYFKDTTVTLSLAENEKKSVAIDYLSNPTMFGSLGISSTPAGATIIINDSVTANVTPDTLSNLLPGTYAIKLRLYNHRELTFNAIVESNRTRFFSQVLRDTSKWIDYQVFNSGLPTNLLSYVAVDNQNNKWIGSFDKGLIKYDGISFTNYNKSNSGIPDNRVNSITVAPGGDIWVATNSGIGIFNGSNWQVYNAFNSGLTSDLINSIEFGNNGITWIGSSSGLFKFDGTDWERYNDSALTFWINDIKIVSNNLIWIGTNTGGIRSFSGGSFTYYDHAEYNYPSKKISSLDIDQNGTPWFCHLPDSVRGGISIFSGNSFTSIFPGSFQNLIEHIFIDSQNKKWISTSEGLILMENLNISATYTTANSFLSSNIITCSVKDKDGNLWVTTQGGGLNKHKEAQ